MFTFYSVPAIAPVLNRTDPSSDSIQVFLNRIPCGKRGGTVTRYEYKINHAASVQTIATRMAGDSFTIVNLTPCTSYTVKARVHTQAGGGPWMEPAIIKTSTQGTQTNYIMQQLSYLFVLKQLLKEILTFFYLLLSNNSLRVGKAFIKLHVVGMKLYIFINHHISSNFFFRLLLTK